MTAATDKYGVLTGEPWMNCPMCWGNGWAWEDFNKPCPMCGGSGEIPTIPRKEELE